MKNMNYKIVALTVSGALLLSGCETMEKAIGDTATAMETTGTAVLVGGVAGAGTGVLCDKLSHGNATGACVAAGMAVGAAAGTLAASLDEGLANAEPGMDCATIKRRMNYSSTESKPKVVLKLASEQPSQVVKPGESLKIPLKMDLATPIKAGEEQAIPVKVVAISGIEPSTGKLETIKCGGDYTWNEVMLTEKEGVHNTTIKLLNVDGSPIDGAYTSVCYTVAKDGVNKCGKVSTQAGLEKSVEPGKKSFGKKGKSKG